MVEIQVTLFGRNETLSRLAVPSVVIPPIDDVAARQKQLELLISAHSKALLSYTRTLLDDHHLAEDIVQETLVRAWHHIEALYANEGSVRGWLLTVARNLAIDWRRSASARHESIGTQDRDMAQPDHADAVVAYDEAVRLLRELSAEHTAVLLHTALGGRTAAEAARALGVPVGTVKSRQHYALAQLRRRIHAGTVRSTPRTGMSTVPAASARHHQ
ncbi:sigma-70 family RNA polymerase sigma factor [Actinoplanes sp. NPDC051343]|uniref:sigma-70 family RNA polymerase sigma factor n=1 Tax=Actinoplanes sp. NPDC051343 TaxID=3363906 RepID=UPI0037A8F6A6